MSEYATPTNTNNPIMNPVVYFRVSAFALTAVGILGVILGLMNATDALSFGNNFLTLTWTHTVLHFVLAAAAFLFGFGNLAGNVVKTFAIIFGFVYGGLGVLGFFVTDPLGTSLNLSLGLGINLVHLLLGAWALVAGFGSRFD